MDIIANKLFIIDKEKFAEDVIQRCKDNNFKEIIFSYDVSGYPNELHITVYNNKQQRENGESAFQIAYEQVTGEIFAYDIKNNPDKFKIYFSISSFTSKRKTFITSTSGQQKRISPDF